MTDLPGAVMILGGMIWLAWWWHKYGRYDD